MRILILGGTGRFIGRAITHELVRRGHDVSIFHRGIIERDDLPDVPHVHGDQRDPRALAPLADEFDALVNVDPLNEADVAALTQTFAGGIRASVHISSGDVYRAFQGVLDGRAPDPVPLREDAPLRERLYPYRGKSAELADYDKILVERAALGTPDFPAAVLRLAPTYGPHDRARREWPFIRRLLDGRSCMLMGGGAEWLWHRLYVDDAATAVATVLESPDSMGRIYNVGEAAVWTKRQLALEVAKAMRKEWEVRVMPDAKLPPALADFRTHPQHMVLHTDAVRRLGWQEALSMQEALRRTVQWHIANPPDESPPDYEKEDALLANQNQDV